MSTTLRVAIYRGAVAMNQVTIRAQGMNGSLAGGVLRFVDSLGRMHPIAKARPDQQGARWVLNFEEGPELVIPPWQGPTRPPSRFHFRLEATAVNPVTEEAEPVLVVVRDDDGPIRASDPDTGEPVADDEVEMADTLHLYLEG